MKTSLLLLSLLLGFLAADAQIIEDFNDNDLTGAPQWVGELSSFKTINGLLQSASTIANSSFSISSAGLIDSNYQWQIEVQLAFNPSSLNYVDFFLVADSANLNKAKSGLFVRLGGSSDEISFFKLFNGVESKLIDGKDGLLNSGNNQYALLILFKNDSFYLMHRKQGNKNWVTEGAVKKDKNYEASHFGLRVKQSTSSFFNKHYFDNIYIGEIVKDSIAPRADSLKLISRTQIQIYFSEPCDSLSLLDHSNYILKEANVSPLLVKLVHGTESVVLTFSDSFPPNQEQEVCINSILDLFGNKSEKTCLLFMPIQAVQPERGDLWMTELMIDPEPAQGLPEKEYIELKNTSGKFLHVKNCSIEDLNTKVILPDMVLFPDSFLVLYKIPALNNSSDWIRLLNPGQSLLHEIAYDNTWYRDESKKGGGYSLEMIDIGRPCLKSENWKASINPKGGTPGFENSVSEKLPPDLDPPQIRRLFTSAPDIIHLEFNELPDSHSTVFWTINGKQEQLRMISSLPGLKQVRYKWPFQPDYTTIYTLEVSGFQDCEGNTSKPILYRLQWPSLASKKQVVFNEVLFNPSVGEKDFIELINNSQLAFDLSALFVADVDAGGLLKNIYPISKTYQVLNPGQYLLLSEDTLSICKKYTCRNPQSVFVQMAKLPSMPDNEGKLVLINEQFLYIDSLHYQSAWHFPFISDENGVSLERLNTHFETNNPANWHSAASVYGFATPGAQNSQIYVPELKESHFSVSSKTLSPDLDGFEDLALINYGLPKPDFIATAVIYDVQGRQIRTLINNETLGSSGFLSWDGSGENGELLPLGIYIVWIECFHPQGDRIREKLTLVLARKF